MTLYHECNQCEYCPHCYNPICKDSVDTELIDDGDDEVLVYICPHCDELVIYHRYVDIKLK